MAGGFHPVERLTQNAIALNILDPSGPWFKFCYDGIDICLANAIDTQLYALAVHQANSMPAMLDAAVVRVKQAAGLYKSEKSALTGDVEAMRAAAMLAMQQVGQAVQLAQSGDIAGAQTALNAAGASLLQSHALAESLGLTVPPEYDNALMQAAQLIAGAGGTSSGVDVLQPATMAPPQTAQAGEQKPAGFPLLFLILSLMGLGT